MNCWTSGKYANLLYMYSILVGAPFALITASIRRGMEVISLWHCWGGMEAQVSLTWPSAICIFLVLFRIFLLTTHIDSLWGQVWWVCWPVKHSNTMVFNQTFGALAVGRCQILLENEISIFKKLVSRRKHEVLQNFLVNGCSDVVFKKHNGPTPADDIAPNHHRLWKLHTGLHATWAIASPPFLQTLGPWFPNEIQTCSHLKRGLWTTGQQSSSSSP